MGRCHGAHERSLCTVIPLAAYTRMGLIFSWGPEMRGDEVCSGAYPVVDLFWTRETRRAVCLLSFDKGFVGRWTWRWGSSLPQEVYSRPKVGRPFFLICFPSFVCFTCICKMTSNRCACLIMPTQQKECNAAAAAAIAAMVVGAVHHAGLTTYTSKSYPYSYTK